MLNSGLSGPELRRSRGLRRGQVLLQGRLARRALRQGGPAGLPVSTRMLGPRHLRPRDCLLRMRGALDRRRLLAAELRPRLRTPRDLRERTLQVSIAGDFIFWVGCNVGRWMTRNCVQFRGGK